MLFLSIMSALRDRENCVGRLPGVLLMAHDSTPIFHPPIFQHYFPIPWEYDRLGG